MGGEQERGEVLCSCDHLMRKVGREGVGRGDEDKGQGENKDEKWGKEQGEGELLWPCDHLMLKDDG